MRLALDFRDDLNLEALTLAQEAGGEGEAGMLAVAWGIENRRKRGPTSLSDVIFQRFQFSCWNTDSPTRMNLDTLDEGTFRLAYKAACAAYFGLVPDPTKGAGHYLNVELTKKIRGDGTLPKWAADPTDATKVNEALVTLRVGKHTFLKL